MCREDDTDLTRLTFLAAGGTSLAAVEFAECIEKTILRGEAQKRGIQDLLDTILHHSFTDLETYVIERLTGRGLEAVKDLDQQTDGYSVVQKSSGEVTGLSKQHNTIGEPDCEHHGQLFWAYLRRGSYLQGLSSVKTNRDITEYTAIGTVQLSLLWRVDIGKCVDASPLIAVGKRLTALSLITMQCIQVILVCVGALLSLAPTRTCLLQLTLTMVLLYGRLTFPTELNHQQPCLLVVVM